ncbi:MAG: IS91 family transposase, partial [Candidatus Competibacteraceae bacterium]|nr:IS91 family transposase [Candidatus Competibacteraceae bacterium]
VTLQGVLQRYLDDYRRTHTLDARRLAVCRHVTQCRTAALGGLQLQCDHCGDDPVHWFSCRDRHCPQCQQRASAAWSEKQQRHVLPATYFHLVFTLPETINGWARLHPEVIYRLLFRAAWETLKAFGANPRRLGGELGMTAVLHTWGQTLSQHLHLHCLVPGGALTTTGDWHPVKGGYLFPVRALSRRFRGRLVSQLRQSHTAGELSRITDPGEPTRTLDRLMQHDWVVYSRPGLRRPEQVLDYLARYTHRTAISNARLLSMEDGQIRFRYKDYRDHDRHKVLSLQAGEFIRRFLQHVLPKGLMRIRHYGFLANRCRRRKLALIRSALAGVQATPSKEETNGAAERFTGYPCTQCGQGMLRITAEVPPRRWEGG